MIKLKLNRETLRTLNVEESVNIQGAGKKKTVSANDACPSGRGCTVVDCVSANDACPTGRGCTVVNCLTNYLECGTGAASLVVPC